MQATVLQARPAAAALGGRRTAARAASGNGARPMAALEAGSRIRVTAPVKVRHVAAAAHCAAPAPASQTHGGHPPLQRPAAADPRTCNSTCQLHFGQQPPKLAAMLLQVYHVAKFKEGLDLQGREATVLKPDVRSHCNCMWFRLH